MREDVSEEIGGEMVESTPARESPSHVPGSPEGEKPFNVSNYEEGTPEEPPINLGDDDEDDLIPSLVERCSRSRHENLASASGAALVARSPSVAWPSQIEAIPNQESVNTDTARALSQLANRLMVTGPDAAVGDASAMCVQAGFEAVLDSIEPLVTPAPVVSNFSDLWEGARLSEAEIGILTKLSQVDQQLFVSLRALTPAMRRGLVVALAKAMLTLSALKLNGLSAEDLSPARATLMELGKIIFVAGLLGKMDQLEHLVSRDFTAECAKLNQEK